MVSLGEIAQHKQGETKCAFVAIARNVSENNTPIKSPSFKESPSQNASPKSSHDASDTDEEDEDRSEREAQSAKPSANAVETDFSVIIKGADKRIASKLNEALDVFRSGLHEELEDLDKHVIVTNHKIDILEQENKRLMQQIMQQAEEIKVLQHEILLAKKGSDKGLIAQVMNNTLTYLGFLQFCQKKNKSEVLMLWKVILIQQLIAIGSGWL